MGDSLKVILDTNIWISFLIGKRLSALNTILHREGLEIYVSDNLIEEITNVALRPKIQRYISRQCLYDFVEMIETACVHVQDYATAFTDIRDEKDIYLIALAESIPADYLVTGDQDLLVLIRHEKCKIITYNQFCAMIEI